jgi:hypothetical protein
MSFQNSPKLDSEQGQIKRYVHQPLTIEHYGIHAKITENGKVIITSAPVLTNGEMEFDEVEIPASLVFKLASALKMTRTETFVNLEKDEKKV